MGDVRDGLAPELTARVDKVLAAMALVGHPMRVYQGLRTVEEQQALYAKGRTVKGPRVTNCDGVVSRSNHQAQADGCGHAVDCCFVAGDAFGETQPWQVYGLLGETVGLKWGGRFVGLVDRPHLEL